MAATRLSTAWEAIGRGRFSHSRGGSHQGRVHAEATPTDQPLIHHLVDYFVEQGTKEVLALEPPAPVLAEGGMARDFALQAQPTEPAVSQVEVDLLAQPPLGGDAEEILSHQHHPSEDLRIPRRPSALLIEGLQAPVYEAEVHMTLDAAKQVVVGDHRFQIHEGEKRSLGS